MKRFAIATIFAMTLSVPALANGSSTTQELEDSLYSEISEDNQDLELRKGFKRRTVCSYAVDVPGLFSKKSKIFEGKGFTKKMAKIRAKRKCKIKTLFTKKCEFVGCKITRK